MSENEDKLHGIQAMVKRSLPHFIAGAIALAILSGAALAQSSGGSGAVTLGRLVYTGSASVSVGTTSGVLVAAGAYTRVLLICTLPGSTSNVWLRADGGTAAANTGIPVWAGGTCTSFGNIGMLLPATNITAITDGASAQTVTLAGG